MIYDYRNDKEILKRIVKHLNMRFPVATISKDLVISKGVVSEYYNGKKPISSNFIKLFENFYDIKFEEFTVKDESKSKIEFSLDETLIENHKILNKLIPFISKNHDVLKEKSPIYAMYIEQVEKEYRQRTETERIGKKATNNNS